MYKHPPGEQEVRFYSARCVDNADIILKRISQLRLFYRSPIRIQKSCRVPVAEALADAIDRTTTTVLKTEWDSLVFLHILALGILISPNTTGSSFSLIIRANLRRLTRSPANHCNLCQQLPCHHARKETSSSENLRSIINSNLMLNDVEPAIGVVASDDTVLEVTPEVLQSPRFRHHPNRRIHWHPSFRPTTSLYQQI